MMQRSFRWVLVNTVWLVGASLLLLLLFQHSHAWTINNNHNFDAGTCNKPPFSLTATTKIIELDRSSFCKSTAAAFFIGSLLPLEPAHATGSLSEQDSIRKSLKPATPDQPQITLTPQTTTTSNVSSKDNNQAIIVEGLLSLSSNPPQKNRPNPTDTIVITLSLASNPDTVVGGARIPMAKARKFPLAIRLFPTNLLSNQQQNFWQVQDKEDILVRAWICPEDNPKCAIQESTLQAQGVAKLIRNLPGQAETQIIRAPVALPLQSKN